MADRPSGTAAGLLLALSLGLVVILGLMCVGAGLFFANSSSLVPVVGPGTPTTGVSGLSLNISTVHRQPDGSYKILVVGKVTGVAEIGQIRVDDVQLTGVPVYDKMVAELPNGDCTVRLPPGPPYGPTLDFVVHTRPLPREQKEVQLNFTLRIADVSSTFEISSSTTLTVDLKAANAAGQDDEAGDLRTKP